MNACDDYQTCTAQGTIGDRRIVAWGTADGTVKQAGGSSDALIGIADFPGGALDGQRVDVARSDFFEVVLGGTVTRGDPLTADANGAAVTATRHGHTENTAATYAQNATTATAAVVRIVGFAEVSGVAGDIIAVAIAPILI